jgi:hypothetical protein
MAASDHGRGAEPEASCGTDIQKTGFKRKSVYLFQKISYNIREDSEEKQEMEADFVFAKIEMQKKVSKSA